MGLSASSLPVALVTGASAGLGLAISQSLARPPLRWRLALTARPDSLHRFAAAGIRESEYVRLRPLDVADGVQRETLFDELNGDWGGVDALINNAGVAYRAVVEHWDDVAWNNIMKVNVRAPMELIRLAMPRMRAKRNGRIVNISSVGGMMAMPTMSLYSAAKFALEGATEALWYEARPWGVKVTLVEPGFIASDSFRNTQFTARSFRGALDDADPYFAHYQRMAALIEKMMLGSWATPERVAMSVARVLRSRRPPLRVYATPDAHLFALMRRVLPRRLYHAVLYRSLPGVHSWGGDEVVPAAPVGVLPQAGPTPAALPDPALPGPVRAT